MQDPPNSSGFQNPQDRVALRPIVSNRGTVIYEIAKELIKILSPLVGQSPLHVQNTMDFIPSIKNIRLQQNECIISYDVKALFTPMVINPDIILIKEKFKQDMEPPLEQTCL